MVDFCEICLTEASDLDDWYLKTRPAHGKVAVIECICPWCVKEMQEIIVSKNNKKLTKYQFAKYVSFLTVGLAVGVLVIDYILSINP